MDDDTNWICSRRDDSREREKRETEKEKERESHCNFLTFFVSFSPSPVLPSLLLLPSIDLDQLHVIPGARALLSTDPYLLEEFTGGRKV